MPSPEKTKQRWRRKECVKDKQENPFLISATKLRFSCPMAEKREEGEETENILLHSK